MLWNKHQRLCYIHSGKICKRQRIFKKTETWKFVGDIKQRTHVERNGDHQEQDKEVLNLSIIFFSHWVFVICFQVDTSN